MFRIYLYSFTLIHVCISRLTGKIILYNLVIISRLFSAVALVVPIHQNVTEGSIATFHCSGRNLTFLSWQINNDIANDEDESVNVTTLHASDTFSSSLRIRALPKYNNSSILCIQYVTNVKAQKFEARLRIQGMLTSSCQVLTFTVWYASCA